METNIQFRHSRPIQIRFNDADALGHINNSIYAAYYDLGKTAYFNAVWGKNIVPDGIDIVVAHAELDFKLPIFLTDEISVESAVTEIGHKSFKLMQRLITNDGVVKSTCESVIVGYDFKQKVSVPISQAWRDCISRFEQKEF